MLNVKYSFTVYCGEGAILWSSSTTDGKKIIVVSNGTGTADVKTITIEQTR